ncbi:MAG: hypothetical protein HKN19_05980 [Halioglobus sp.]|nr:hypothetical protein [Halioglobus sp.]
MQTIREGSIAKVVFWLGLAIVLLCVITATHFRLAQYDAWRASAPDVGKTAPMMATLDAYYYLRWAEAYRTGDYKPHAPDALRLYQRQQYKDDPPVWQRWRHDTQWLPQLEPKRLPELSALLAFASRFCSGSVDCAGVVLPPLLSSLFLLPLFFYAWRVGLPAAGIMGGLVATFCHAYYRRGGAGWVDTDALNLFFPWCLALFILLAGREQSRLQRLCWAAVAGATMHAYYLWYERPGLAIVFLLALLTYQLSLRISLREVALSGLAFSIFANPLQLLLGLPSLGQFLRVYFKADATAVTAAEPGFPDVMATVSEVDHVSWYEVFSRVLHPPELAMLGLAAFIVMALPRWRLMIPLSPLLLLGLLSFYSSQRFVMYLAPFVGLGLGYLVTVILQALITPGDRNTTGSTARSMASNVVPYAGALALFAFWIAPRTAIYLPFTPALPAPIYSALQELGTTLPKQSRLWTWWDTGFMIPYVVGAGVYHDGGAQKSPQTYFVAHSLVHTEQRVLRNIVSFVDAYGNRGIEDAVGTRGSRAAAVAHIARYPGPLRHEPVFVAFTADMIGKYPSLHKIGAWDFLSGAPQTAGFAELGCTARYGDILDCGELEINLRLGMVGDSTGLRKTELIENGRVVQTIEHRESGPGNYLQILIKDTQPYAVYLLNEASYRSNFNQMFLLGRFDEHLFEEVYNRFPAVRVFRVKPANDAAGAE